jgi:hypothetical protein
MARYASGRIINGNKIMGQIGYALNGELGRAGVGSGRSPPLRSIGKGWAAGAAGKHGAGGCQQTRAQQGCPRLLLPVHNVSRAARDRHVPHTTSLAPHVQPRRALSASHALPRPFMQASPYLEELEKARRAQDPQTETCTQPAGNGARAHGSGYG